MRPQSAIFANFILRFGESELIDYVSSIVIPALTNPQLVKKYGGYTEYFIFDGQLIQLNDDLSNPEMAIIGQFIKKTRLVRHQVFKAQVGPVADEASIASAPSAFFILMLRTHRLIYYPETPNAPDLTAFKSSVKQFVHNEYKAFFEKDHTSRNDRGEKISKFALRLIHSPPTLEIIPLTGAESISTFVDRYSVLKSIEFRIVKPNAEIDGQAVFTQLRALSDGLKSVDTRLTTSSGKGLDKQASKVQIRRSTEQGNQEVSLDGVDYDGNKLKGNNDEFRVSVPITDPPKTRKRLSAVLYDSFMTLVQNGTIKTGVTAEKVKQILMELAE